MDIDYTLYWERVLGATSYKLWSVNATGGETEVTSGITDTNYTVTISDNANHVYIIRSYDGTEYGAAQYFVYNAPQTLGNLVDAILVELRDSTSRRWARTEIIQYIQDAIRDYTKLFPKTRTLEIDLTEDVREYTLPPQVITVQRVEYVNSDSNSYFLKYLPWAAGQSDISSATSSYWKLGVVLVMGSASREYCGHYDVRDDVLSIDFDPDPDESLKIRCTWRFTIPPFEAAKLDVPEEDLELLKLYSCGKAMVRIEMQDANLSRWTEGQRRDDNPVVPSANRYFNAYNQMVKDKQNKPRTLRRRRM